MKLWNRRKKVDATQPTQPLVFVHEALIGCSVSLLQAKGDQTAHECVLYWAGKNFGKEWIVTTCILPRARTTQGSVETSSANNAEVVAFLAKSKLHLLAQVHSHPGKLVGHSAGDDEGALMPYESFLSIVVPSYGRYGILPFTQCGVHRFERGRFRRLPNGEIQESLAVINLCQNMGGDR